MRDIEEQISSITVYHFIERIKGDNRMTMPHLCLFVALLHACIADGGRNPFYACRSKLMTAAKIRAKSTYHKCMNDLVCQGCISYYPSYHPKKGSLFFLYDGK